LERLLTTLILLNPAGVQCEKDLARLEGDEGLALILQGKLGHGGRRR
jgi:hypothetical protein